MANYGEWTSKGATLSDGTAQKEYGVSEDFILQGIRSGKIEFREGAMHGNPFLRILRSQLENYIAEELGQKYLQTATLRTELRNTNQEIKATKKRLDELMERKAEITCLLDRLD